MVKAAFLFPGQGSQSVGMGRSFIEGSEAARKLAQEADETLGFSLTSLCLEGPEEALKRTVNSQPAILLVSLCALAAFREKSDLQPAAVAGHSLGEYSALVAAGALGPMDALKLVRRRGELMEEAAVSPPGAMAAVMGMSAEDLAALCQEEVEPVTLANLNSPEQIIISGTQAAVERVGATAKAAGAKRVLPLAVSGGFHSPLMEPAAQGLRAALKEVAFQPLRTTVIANVTAEPIPDASAIPELLAQQVTSSVRWHETMQRLAAEGITHFIELGPGKVLSNLAKRGFPNATALNVDSMESLEAALGVLAG
ncbi:MAG TPA: ACP S-malonyltransferase [Armatimonadota bacterium]|jgi:[acyl-carrier-protein] S-malonyltransferase